MWKLKYIVKITTRRIMLSCFNIPALLKGSKGIIWVKLYYFKNKLYNLLEN